MFTTPGRRAVHRAADPSRRQAARPVRPEQRGDWRCGAKAARRGRHASRSARSSASGSSATRRRRSPPRPCSRKPRASSASARSRRCGWRSSSTKASSIDGETAGLITYMRTDGVQMAREAIAAIREHVNGSYGRDYLPAAPREYTSKAKNAQEAHEAIRPTDVARTPDSVAHALESRSAAALRADLEARRRVADAVGRARPGQRRRRPTASGVTLRATGSIVAFDGFLKLYREDTDDAEGATDDEDSRMLPPMAERDPLKRGDVDANQHFTQPPPRYSEASLVEEDGGARHRPALHLCLDPLGAAGPQICAAGQAALHPGGPRPAGDRVPGQLLRALRRYRLHRRAGGKARRHLRRASSTGGR